MSTTLKGGVFDQTLVGEPSDIFEKNRDISRGAGGSVISATMKPEKQDHPPLPNVSVAIKIINKNNAQLDNERKALEHFQNNGLFELPGITKSYAGFYLQNDYHVVSECAGGDLKQLLGNVKHKSLSDDWLLRQFKDLAQAVKAIHGPLYRNIGFHHDIKPGNILFFEHHQLKLTDWGSTCVNQAANFTKIPLANPTYLPPESQGKDSVSETARPHDIWSLGCIFLEMLIWYHHGPTELDSFKTKVKEKDKMSKLWITDKSKLILTPPARIAIEDCNRQKSKALKHLPNIIGGMLRVNDSRRLKAERVIERLS